MFVCLNSTRNFLFERMKVKSQRLFEKSSLHSTFPDRSQPRVRKTCSHILNAEWVFYAVKDWLFEKSPDHFWKVKELVSSLPNGLAKPLFNVQLSEKQWHNLAQINQSLYEDFLIRRELLMTRLDVTIQSFKWADSIKKSYGEITSIYQKYRSQLSFKPNIKLFHILCARESIVLYF